MFTGGIIIIIGTAIIASSSVIPQFVVGRFVLGVGIATMTVSAPAYAIEISPPHWRGRATGETPEAPLSIRVFYSNGRILGFYNCGWFGGSIPAAAIVYGTQYIPSDWSWRIPLILQAFACVVVMFTIWFIPESPRWLMANGKTDEAVDFLVKYHGNGDPNSRLVRLEIEEMREGIRLDGIDKRPWDCK